MIERDINRAMWRYLPRYYEDIRESRAIVNPQSAEFERLNGAIRDVLDQYFVDRATWGLAYWERAFGITIDESKPRGQRRSVIKSKMRGAGTVTVDFVKDVAEAYDNGEVEVTEDNANYTIIVTFVGTRGVPPNLADTERALRDIIPAHLDVKFEFTFLTWEELSDVAMSWADLDAQDLTWAEFERARFLLTFQMPMTTVLTDLNEEGIHGDDNE